MAIDVTIITQAEQTIYGVWRKSNDKTVAKDIPALSRKYYDMIGKPSGSVLPFYVLSKDYNEKTGQFDLFIGGESENGGLEMVRLPEGAYGKITVKPKLGFLWSIAIGEAKRHFYTKWLTASGYEAVNMEYEFHTEKSVVKKPKIDLFFSIRCKQA